MFAQKKKAGRWVVFSPRSFLAIHPFWPSILAIQNPGNPLKHPPYEKAPAIAIAIALGQYSKRFSVFVVNEKSL